MLFNLVNYIRSVTIYNQIIKRLLTFVTESHKMYPNTKYNFRFNLPPKTWKLKSNRVVPSIRRSSTYIL